MITALDIGAQTVVFTAINAVKSKGITHET
jgi:hypothetical protein